MTPSPTPERSKCCNAEILTGLNDDNGENIAWCSKCVRSCPIPQDTPPRGEEDNGTCCEGGDFGQEHRCRKENPSPLADTVGGEECEHDWGNYDDGEGGNSWFECRKCKTQRDTPPSKQSEVDRSVDKLTERQLRGLYEGLSTPPKAEGYCECRHPVKSHWESGLCSDCGASCGHRTKAEGVGGDVLELCLNLYVDEQYKPMVRGCVTDLLTSATRAAEERKDGEFKAEIIRLHDQDYPHGDDNPDFIMGYKNAMRDLMALLPPPPDKPTTNG